MKKSVLKKSELDLILDSHIRYFSDKEPIVPSLYQDINKDFFRIDNKPRKSDLEKNQTIQK